MITNNKEINRKDDIKILCFIMSCFMVVAWLCTPLGNKFAHLCFYGNNTQYIIAKLTKSEEEIQAWKILRNNAVYLIQMDKPIDAIKEINEAISKYPTYMPEAQLNELYYTRAKMRVYIGDYTGALNDFAKVNDISVLDHFRIALMYKNIGNNRLALQHCNEVLNREPKAYVGYACVANLYAGIGKYEVAVKVYDLLIDKVSNRAQYYIDRAIYKKMSGDFAGSVKDVEIAKSILPDIKEESTIFYDTLHPKRLDVKVLK